MTTNLTDKISTLSDRLDTVIAKLETSNTKLTEIATSLTGASGNIDATPIVAAIAALRGDGPENTVKSLNQSLWNLAGPAPGKTLTDVHALLSDLKSNLGLPTGDATTTLLGLLASVQYALATDSAATLYGLVKVIAGELSLPSTIDDSVLSLLDKIRTASNATNIALKPLAIPSDACTNAYTSNGTANTNISLGVVGGGASGSIGGPITMATWPALPPAGITIGSSLIYGNDTLHSDDWSNYRIYVGSKAASFGVSFLAAQRFNTNEWITLAGNEDFTFFVDGYVGLTVTICGDGSNAAYTYESVSDGISLQIIQWSATIDAVDDRGGYHSPRAYRVGDFYGWRVRSAEGCVFDAWNDNAWLGQYYVGVDSATINLHMTHINFRSSSPFVLEMLPPI